MIPIHRLVGRSWVVALVLAIVGTGQVARAQDQDDVEDDVIAPVAGAVMMVQQPNVDQVDNWVFGRFGGSAVARTRFDSALALRIDDLERTCGVTEAQKKKLKLAGRGDVKRVFDRVEELKRKFLQNQNDPNNNIWQAMQPLQVEVNAGLFGERSIFQKTIKKTLDGDQASRYDSLMRERKLSRYRATVEWFVVHLDKVLGLSDDQRRRFTELILSETDPPARFGQSDYWYLLFQISQLPEAKSKPIFDTPQWRLLSRQLMQGRGMEQWLKTNGVLEDHKKAGGNAAMFGPMDIPAMRLQEAIAIPRARAIRVAPVQPAVATKKDVKQEKVGQEKNKN
ncbi:MAG: hypothetical protein ACHRXM_29030 [Isosphaerales bacterium]